MQCEISYFTWKFLLKSCGFSLFYVNFQVKFLHSFCMSQWQLGTHIWHRSNDHEASASTLRSDSVATLDSGHTVSTSFFSVCLMDQQHQPHRTNSSTKLGCWSMPSFHLLPTRLYQKILLNFVNLCTFIARMHCNAIFQIRHLKNFAFTITNSSVKSCVILTWIFT